MLIAIIGLYEFYNAFSKKGYSPFKPYGLFNIGILALMLYKDGSYMSTNVKINGIGDLTIIAETVNKYKNYFGKGTVVCIEFSFFYGNNTTVSILDRSTGHVTAESTILTTNF